MEGFENNASSLRWDIHCDMIDRCWWTFYICAGKQWDNIKQKLGAGGGNGKKVYPNRALSPSYIKNMRALLGTDRATVMPQPAYSPLNPPAR